MKFSFPIFSIGLVAVSLLAGPPDQKSLDPEIAKQAHAAVDRGIGYLRGTQNSDGSFAEADYGPAVTGLVVTGLLRTKHVTPADPMVARALAYLEKNVQPGGGIYVKGGNRNYPTAICTMAFIEANRDGRYQSVIDNAIKFLKEEQWDEGEGITPENPKYGGAGYGKRSRPDLSNTTFWSEALYSAGYPKDDPAFQRALLFVTRCQNLSGEGANDLPQAALIDDGGFYYTPAEDYNPGGGSIATGLRSYGSMTYAGLKSLIYAGLDKDDRRVQAATSWIRKNYTLEENPGVGQQGLFYYYHTFAKTLSLLEIEKFVDAKGKEHDWRADLVRKLVEKQSPSGSWENPTTRWLENDPRLVTAYVLMTLGCVMN